ncbi:MAG: FMN-binding protein [Flavobacteriales bacterium]|nr:FMN-binding protein [Flavobacteriales bacterium]
MQGTIFFMKEMRKIIATLIVAIVFLYFWINGPLLQIVEAINLEAVETKYSIPILVGSDGVDSKSNTTSFNTLNFEDEESFGHVLLLVKKTPNNNWGFIADVKNNPGLSEELKTKIYEHAQQFSKKEDVIKTLPSMEMYYATISGKDKSIYLESTDIIKNIRGYAGEINVGVFIGEDGYIKRVEHIASKETQSYLSDIRNAGFYEQFKNISITKGDQQIDAVSGATLSSEAIANTVSQLISEGTPYPISNYSEIDEVNFFSLSAILNSTWIIHIVVIFLMFAFAMQHWIKKSKKTILILSSLSVIYIGFFLNNSFTYISFIHPFVGTSVSSLVGLYALFVLLGAIWGKNTYCKYVCPFGNIQRLIIQVNPLKTSKKFFISNKWIKRIRAAIAIVLLTGVLLGLRNWSNFELFPDLFGLSVLSVWFVITVITILLTMVYPMIWCRLLCPTGSILDGLSDLVNYKRKK